MTPDEHIALLRERGLIINDENEAKHYLKFVGYYRLTGYMLAFQQCDGESTHHTFAPNTTFKDVLDTYIFDRKLRLLVMDAVERIELGIKSVIINEMCILHGTHWYTNKDHFTPRFNFKNFIKTIKKSVDYGQREKGKVRNTSLEHYYQTYNTPPMPPLWMVFEVSSFGTVSLMYEFLSSRADKNRIADQIHLHTPILESWLHTTSVLRNLCAHHVRIWNRVFAFRPATMNKYKDDFTPDTMFYTQAAMLNVMLKSISPSTSWAQKLKVLFDEYANIDKTKMGFNDGWEQRDIWQK